MLKLRQHPNSSWPSEMTFVNLDERPFRSLNRLAFDSHSGSDVTFTSGRGRMRIRVCAPGILRFTVAPDGELPPDALSGKQPAGIGITRYDWPACRHTVTRSARTVTLQTSRMTARIALHSAGLEVLDAGGRRLLATRPGGLRHALSGGQLQTLSFFERDEHEQFFGFGGRSHRPNRTGSSADMFAIKVETRRGDYGGLPLPYFLSTRGYGFLLDNPWPHVHFDMGRTRPDQWFLHTPGGYLDFYVLAGPEFADIAGHYARLTGLPALPDKWQLGLWVSWTQAWNAEKTAAVARRLRDERWPFDVMVVDWHWRVANLEWDPARFGDGPALARLLHDLNAHFCLHLNNSMFGGQPMQDALKSGALRTPENNVVVPNLPDADAADWYWRTHEPRVHEGCDLWWTDNGERVEGTLSCGLPSRNLYGQLWNQLLFDRMAAMGRPNRLVLTRGGWLGAQRNALTWPGDTGPGVERLREDLWWHLNCSVSGIPYNTVDYGGFFGDFDDSVPLAPQHDCPADHRVPAVYARLMHSAENIVRRVANGMLLFTVPRLHGPAKLPWMYSQPVQEIWRFFHELRYRMFPLYYSLVVDCSRTGEPPHRPVVWHDRESPDAWRAEDQIFLGRDILMAPILDETALEREVYLPAGTWFDFWTGERHAGPAHIVADAPLFKPQGLPVFVREGAVVPMRRLCQFNADAPDAELILHLWPARRGRRVFHDAPELTYEVSYERRATGVTVTVNNPLDVPRRIHLVVHGLDVKSGVGDRDLAFPFEGKNVTSVEIPAGKSVTCRVT